MPRSSVFIAVLLVAVVLGVPARAIDVDLSLVLAIDASSSVNEERYELQIRGYAEAFGNPRVANAIVQSGAIAVTLVQWAGYGD
jgi:ABC-type spermidine/putrescine transport system permease subunit II